MLPCPLVFEMRMRDLLHITQPGYQGERFWNAGCLSTWVRHPVCSGCGRPGADVIQPYAIEWSRDRWNGKEQVVGDFIWAGAGSLTVTERVKVACQQHGITGLVFHPVEAHSPKPPRKTAKPIQVDAPPIWLAKPTVTAHLDLARSGRRMVTECGVCRFRTWDVAPNARVVVVVPPDNALPDVFVVDGFCICFCTERFREMALNEQFTNVEIKLRGIVED